MLRLLAILAALIGLSACEMNDVGNPSMEAGDALSADQDTDGDPTFDAGDTP